MYQWEDRLRVKLTEYVEQAVAEVDEHFMDSEGQAVFPWVGDNVFRLMADAAITVLKGIEDTQEYLIEDGQLER
jgi:cell division septal protein FtsQ